MQFFWCSRGAFAVVLAVLRSSYDGAYGDIFKILDWGGRGMRFVKSEEILSGLLLFRHT